MTTTNEIPRPIRLQVWLDDKGYSQGWLGEKLGVAQSTVSEMLRAETIPTRHHDALTDLGIPSDLLPMAKDKPRGRKRKVPHLPALTPETADQPVG